MGSPRRNGLRGGERLAHDLPDLGLRLVDRRDRSDGEGSCLPEASPGRNATTGHDLASSEQAFGVFGQLAGPRQAARDVRPAPTALDVPPYWSPPMALSVGPSGRNTSRTVWRRTPAARSAASDSSTTALFHPVISRTSDCPRRPQQATTPATIAAGNPYGVTRLWGLDTPHRRLPSRSQRESRCYQLLPRQNESVCRRE